MLAFIPNEVRRGWRDKDESADIDLAHYNSVQRNTRNGIVLLFADKRVNKRENWGKKQLIRTTNILENYPPVFV